MKSFKFISFAAITLIGAVLVTSAQAQNGQFVSDSMTANNWPVEGTKAVSPADLLFVDENPATKTLTMNYADGVTVENWAFSTSADYNAILDRFVTGARANGNDFFYTSIYGSNSHRRVSYHNVRKIDCSITTNSGGTFYTVTITLKTGTTLVSNGYSINQCQYFML